MNHSFRPLTGVDTLRVQARFKIPHLARNLIVKKHPWDPSKDSILWVGENQTFTGIMACLEHGLFNVRISPPRRAKGKNGPWGTPMATITFSVSRVVTGSNSPIATREDFEEAIKAVQKWLRDEGIEVDLWRAKIVTLHIARNFLPTQPLEQFTPVSWNFHMQRESYYKRYPTGFVSGNKSQRIKIYDKKAEIKNRARLKGLDKDDQERALKNEERFLGTAETGRIEWELRTAKKVKSQLKIETPSDLLFCYGQLGQWMDGFIQTHLLRHDRLAMEIAKTPRTALPSASSRSSTRHRKEKQAFNDILKNINLAQTSGRRKSLSKALEALFAAIGVEICEKRFNQSFISAILKELFLEQYGDKKGAEKYKEFRAHLRSQLLHKVIWHNGEATSVAEMYLEFRDALLRDAKTPELVKVPVAVPLPETNNERTKEGGAEKRAA
jgi:hypothetical protein